MPGTVKPAAGDDEQVKLLRSLGEGHIVRDQRPGKQVERAAGGDHMIAHLGQFFGQQFCVLLIDGEVGGQVAAGGRHPLNQAGSADIAQRPSCPGNGGVDPFTVLHLTGDINVADALAGEGEGFGPAVNHQRVAVELGDVRYFHPRKGDLPVGLVADEVDGVSVLVGLFFQQSGEFFQRLLGIHRSGGVVGGVDNEQLGFRRDEPFQGGKVDLKTLDLRGRHLHDSPHRLDKDAVLREKGGKDHDLISRIAQPPQAAAEPCGSAYRHVELAGLTVHTESTVDRSGDFRP